MWMTEDAPFIPNYDTIPCYQLTCLPVSNVSKVFLDFITFQVFVAPIQTCLWHAAGIIFRISKDLQKIYEADQVKH